jgi:hypothetical protein
LSWGCSIVLSFSFVPFPTPTSTEPNCADLNFRTSWFCTYYRNPQSLNSFIQ